MNAKIIRQGDVWFIPVAEVPASAKRRKDRTIALGEATGHHHTLTETATVFGELNGQQWVVVEEAPAEVVHQEHAPLVLEVGYYEVRIARRYTPEEIVRSTD
jgi:hypothetical protein